MWLIENVFYYDNGQIHIKSEYENGKLNGEFVSYWENGKLKRKDLYKKGKLKDGTCWNKNGKKVEYYDFEIHPELPKIEYSEKVEKDKNLHRLFIKKGYFYKDQIEKSFEYWDKHKGKIDYCKYMKFNNGDVVINGGAAFGNDTQYFDWSRYTVPYRVLNLLNHNTSALLLKYQIPMRHPLSSHQYHHIEIQDSVGNVLHCVKTDVHNYADQHNQAPILERKVVTHWPLIYLNK